MVALPWGSVFFGLSDQKNTNAVITFEVELNNKSKIKVIGYNKIADKCYKELEKEDTIWIEGRIEEKQIVIKIQVKVK